MIWLLTLLLIFMPQLSLASVTAGITVTAAAIDECLQTEDDCVAPLAVHFHARTTTCDGASASQCDNSPYENEAFHTLHYEWDFGDPKSETWAASGQDKNVEYGPLAIHVYDDAGTYTVTLKVWSTSEYDEETATVYVDDADTFFGDPNDTLCVAADSLPVAGVGGCPTGASVLNQGGSDDWDGPIETYLAAGYRRILYKAGDTFDVDSSAAINVDGPGHIGSYGTANDGRAILDNTTTCQTCCILSATGGVQSDWRFVDLEVEHEDPNGLSQTPEEACFYPMTGGDWALDKTLIYRIKQISGNSFLLSMRCPVVTPRGCNGLILVDNDVEGMVYGFYFATMQGGAVGNTLTMRGDIRQDYSHGWRLGAGGEWVDMVMSHNEIDGIARTTTATVRGDATVVGSISQYMVMRANKFNDIYAAGGSPRFAAISFAPSANGQDERMQDVIFENNRIENYLEALAVKTITVRNNLFTNASWNNGYARIRINTDHTTGLPTDWTDDTMIYNNSAYRTGSGEHFIQLTDGPTGVEAQLPDALYIRNNVLWNTNADAEVVSCDDGEEFWCGTITESNNIDRDDMTATPYASATPDWETNSDWYLRGATANVAVDAGFSMGSTVRNDFENNERHDAQWDIGAFELKDRTLGSCILTGGSAGAP